MPTACTYTLTQACVCAHREDTGEHADGRHYKRYYLQEAGTRQEYLAVEGLDSVRQDRK